MIVSADWIFPVTSPPLVGHCVVVEGGKIHEIRPVRSSDPVNHGATLLLPGFINAHTHLAYTALRDQFDDLSFFPWIRALTETKYKILNDEDIALSTQLGVSECLRSGITTVADMSDLEASLRVLSKSPMRGIFYWEVFGVEKEAADETWRSLDSRFHQLKASFETSRLKLGISPHACYTVRPELYRKIAGWAKENQVPVSFHVAESEAEEDFVANNRGPIADFLRTRASDWKFLGSSSIEHLYQTGIFETRPLVAHAVQSSDSDLEILKQSGVRVAHCPKSNARFVHGIAPVYEMIQKGIPVSLGTDSAASSKRLDLLEEGRLALQYQRSGYGSLLSNQKMLEMLTIDGARAMNLEKEIGSLEIGKQADMVLVNIPASCTTADQVLNHLIWNTKVSDIQKTFVSGEEASLSEPDLSTLSAKLSRKV